MKPFPPKPLGRGFPTSRNERGMLKACSGHARGMLEAKDVAAEGSLAGDKKGYKYPLGGIWKKKRIFC